MNDFILKKELSDSFEADGQAMTRTEDQKFAIKVWVSVRKDSQIPDFDAISDMKFLIQKSGDSSEGDLSEDLQELEEKTTKLAKAATEIGGMFINDALKLKDRDFDEGNKVFSPLAALKMAIYNYLEKTEQFDRLKKAVSNIVCSCRQVTDQDILDQIKKGRTTFEEISLHTGAGTGCQGCIPKIKKIIKTASNTPF